MRPTQHTTNNRVLHAPKGASHDECVPLAITDVKFEGGGRAVASFWQPSNEELALLNQGKPVRIIILGLTHAPMLLGVDGDGVM